MKPSDRAVAEGVLYTDEYQLTMAQIYYRAGLHDRHVQFDHFFRSCPDYGQHQAGYCVYAGLEWLLDWMAEVRVTDGDITHLASQRNSRGEPVFQQDFLDWFREAGSFDGLTVRAVQEGRVVHPNVPLTVVQGPLVMAQILETALLNQLNYQTLIATKAARIRESCRGQTVLEFGLRRAQDRGGNAGARAALIGGADFSSNVGISHVLGYPPKGTHAHSMVQIFMTLGEGELGAFRAYADLYPESCLLLVDTIDTLGSGLPNAIRVFEELRKKGHEPVGVRLDSGDLAYLAIQAARMLNAAGFEKAKIVLSNQLDELVIWQILTQIEAEASRYGVDPDHLVGRLMFGVGTRLITSRGASALDGVYKLVAVHDGDEWRPSTKISETPDKTINPGFKNVWRLYDRRGMATADLLSLEDEVPRGMGGVLLRHPVESRKIRTLSHGEISEAESLLVDVLRDGRRLFEPPSIEEMRERRRRDIQRLDPGVRRLVNPHRYHVSLSGRLWDLKQELISSVGSALDS
jgi:nicotinate phosphoribosyltransferase